LTDEIFDAAISGLTERTIDRLRVELAKERERADAHYRVLEFVTAERDALRAELAAEREAKQSAVDQAEAFKDERDALREALKPFALMATELEYEGSKWLDHETHWLKCFDFQLEPTVGDLRRASAALKGDDRD